MARIPEAGEWDHDTDPPDLEVIVTDNPVVAVLFGPDGRPIRQWRARPPLGFQLPHRRTPP